MASQCPWKEISSGPAVIAILKGNQLKNKYVTNKIEKSVAKRRILWHFYQIIQK